MRWVNVAKKEIILSIEKFIDTCKKNPNYANNPEIIDMINGIAKDYHEDFMKITPEEFKKELQEVDIKKEIQEAEKEIKETILARWDSNAKKFTEKLKAQVEHLPSGEDLYTMLPSEQQTFLKPCQETAHKMQLKKAGKYGVIGAVVAGLVTYLATRKSTKA